MPNVLTSPSSQTTVGLIGGAVVGVAELARGQASIANKLGAVHDILAGVFAYTPLGPLIAIQGGLVRLTGGLYEKSLAKEELHKIKRRFFDTAATYTETGQNPIYALRAGLARAGLNPETVLPLAEPVQIAPGYSYESTRTYDVRNRFGQRRTETRTINVPAQYAPDVAASQTFYDPETKATGTAYGALLKYGTGGGADLARQARQEELFAYLSGRPVPGAGAVPASIVRTTKGP